MATAAAGEWADNEIVTVSVTMSGFISPYWVQSSNQVVHWIGD